MKGVFITFEGGEGCGKTTQIQYLRNWLRDNQPFLKSLITREPGGTEGGDEIRKLLLEGNSDRWLPVTEALMMHASRHEHVERVIRPALARGEIVISDRFIDSTDVYQGFVAGVKRSSLDFLTDLSCGKIKPDLTFLLDIDSETGLARTLNRVSGETRFESKGKFFHEKVRKGFMECSKASPRRFIVLDASRSEKEIFDDIKRHFISALASKGLI